MRVLLDKRTIDYMVRIEGAVTLGTAPTPRTDQNKQPAKILTTASLSTNIDEPTWLSTNAIRGEGVGENVSHYYTFMAERGTVKVIADGKNEYAGSANALGVVLMDLDANKLLKIHLGNTTKDKRVVKRVKIHRPQQIIMRVLLNKATIDYKVRVEGAVNLEAAQTPSTDQNKQQAKSPPSSEASTIPPGECRKVPGKGIVCNTGNEPQGAQLQ
jgi:hypothetical protein